MDRDDDGYGQDLLVDLPTREAGGMGGMRSHFPFPFVTIEDVEMMTGTPRGAQRQQLPGLGGRLTGRDENELI